MVDRGKTMALDWIAESLRLSLFSNGMVDLTGADWKKITGEDEAETQQKVAGRRTMAGTYLAGTLNVSAVGPRIDCVLSPHQLPKENAEEAYVPSLGAWPMVCDEFFKGTTDWVGSFDRPVVRMAFGATLYSRFPDRQAAYSALIGLLKSVQGDPKRLNELVFRINWPVNSKSLNDLMLNRITQWAVLEMRAFQLVIQSGAEPVVGSTPVTFVIRLELDHNTDAQWATPFDPRRLVPIYRELVELAYENAEKGELT
jgi:hypothetical protein